MSAKMILLDRPYVSDFLLRTIRERELPVVLTPASREFGAHRLPSAITEREAIERALDASDPLVHTVSESSIGWITEHLAGTCLPDRIARFKDKARFRRETAALFPQLRFRELRPAELDDFDPEGFPAPFVVKPSVGFFSLGVRRVEHAGDWPAARAALAGDLERTAGLFPREVLDGSRLLVESCVAGRELAVDAFFDAEGEPVVLSVFEHLFARDDDTSDRVYVTSAALLRDYRPRFTDLMRALTADRPLRNFAVHVEARVDAADRIVPIEVNPARFGGWCTTADLTHAAFGVNPYAYLHAPQRPDRDAARGAEDDRLFGIVVLGNTTGIPGTAIRSFDYDGVLARFATPLELRRVDFRRYPLFGFVFTETGDVRELERILRSDLREFVTTA